MTPLPSQLEVAIEVGRALEGTGSTWMIGGSIATSTYGEPRSTHDVDLVADLIPARVPGFVRALGEDYYADLDVILDSVRRRASFNVIHMRAAEKVDVFCVQSRFAAAGLRARIAVDLGGGRVVPVAPPAHMVVEKLRGYRRGGEVSDRQLRDVQGVLQVRGRLLDRQEMRDWADEVGVRDLLERALVDAGLVDPGSDGDG